MRNFNTQASSLALQTDFMGTNLGSRSTLIYYSCRAAKKSKLSFFFIMKYNKVVCKRNNLKTKSNFMDGSQTELEN
jgi:hypothetical protein